MFPKNSKYLSTSLAIAMSLTLSACGGGSGSDNSDDNTNIDTHPDTTEVSNDPETELTGKELALNKIKAYANGETNTAPTLSDYQAAGVNGVTNETLAELNARVKDLSPEEVDSTAELNALSANLGINIAPLANAGINQTIEVNKSIQITGSGSDADGTIVAYSWKKQNTVIATSASFVYTPSVVGTDILTLTVTDDDGDTAVDNISVIVTAVPTITNQSPTANAGQNISAEVGMGVNVAGTGSDSDGTIATYEWSSAEGTVLATTPTFVYTPTSVGTDTLTLKVIDNDGASDSDTINVFVSAAPPATNDIPILSAATIQNYLTTINNARTVARSCGVYGNFPAVAAVSWSDKLYKASYEHSQDMTESNTFDHDGSGTVSDWTGYPLGQKSTMAQRVATYNYNWSRLSENITAGTFRNTVQKAMDSWITSDGHCKNIMDPNVTEVGLALSSKQGTTYTNYWTQKFGRR